MPARPLPARGPTLLAVGFGGAGSWKKLIPTETTADTFPAT